MNEDVAQPSVMRATLLRDQVYDILHARVLNGILSPGDRLVEDEIAGQLGVSRTPVREAIRRLQIEGLVTASKGGHRLELASAGQQDLEDTLDIRLLLERYAVERAARFATAEQLNELKNLCAREQECLSKDPEKCLPELSQLNWKFHKLIVAAAHNQTLSIIVEQVLINSAYRLYALGDLLKLNLFAASHLRIINALEQHDEDAASAEMTYHIDLMHKILLPPENALA